MQPKDITRRKYYFVILSIIFVLSPLLSILINLLHNYSYDNIDLSIIGFIFCGTITYISIIILPCDIYRSKCYKRYIYSDSSETVNIVTREFTTVQKIFRLINCYRAVEIEAYPKSLYIYLYILPLNITNSIFAIISGDILSFRTISALLIFPASLFVGSLVLAIHRICTKFCCTECSDNLNDDDA